MIYKKREQLLRLRPRGICKHPKHLTSNAHALGRESSTWSCVFFLKFCRFSRTRFSGRFNVYVYLLLSSAHRQLSFVKHYCSACKDSKRIWNGKEFDEKYGNMAKCKKLAY